MPLLPLGFGFLPCGALFGDDCHSDCDKSWDLGNNAMASHRNLPRSFGLVDSDDEEDYQDPEVSIMSYSWCADDSCIVHQSLWTCYSKNTHSMSALFVSSRGIKLPIYSIQTRSKPALWAGPSRSGRRRPSTRRPSTTASTAGQVQDHGHGHNRYTFERYFSNLTVVQSFSVIVTL